jgi:hypothetical protein
MTGPLLSSADVQLLLAWMAAEASAQSEILDILVEQRGCMVRHDLDGLESLATRSQAGLRRLEAATRSRAAAVSGVWRGLGRAGPPTLDAILDAASDEDRPALACAREALRQVIENVRRTTRLNQVLARTGLDVNRALVHAVFGDGDPQRTYDRDARTRTGRPVNACVDREL